MKRNTSSFFVLFFFLILSLSAQAAVVERDAVCSLFNQGNWWDCDDVPQLSQRHINFCWWGLIENESLPAGLMEIENHLVMSLRTLNLFSVNKDWPRCESLPAEAVNAYLGIVIYDNPNLYSNQSLHKVMFSENQDFIFDITGANPDTKKFGHPRALSNPANMKLKPWDLVLTSQFRDVEEGLEKDATELSDAGKLNLKKTIALHETLHVLGSIHEHVHPLSECLIESDPPYKEVHVSYDAYFWKEYYDPDSIMSYCKTKSHDYEGGPIPLSSGDIEGFKKAFEFPFKK